MIRKVVIIDDEPWTRGVIVNLAQCSSLGLEVVGEAADGEAGLTLIRKVLPDIVITDVRMPRIGGIELVQTLRSEGFQMPVLIVSGYDDFSYVRSALKLGVTDYLLKPIKAQELNLQLQRCIEILDREDIAKPKTVMQAGFFADGWENRYAGIRKKLEDGLYAGNVSVIRQQFSQLDEVVRSNEGEHPSTAVLIGLYYAMLFPLQKYVEKMGLSRSRIFGEAGPCFVFGQDNTLEQMLEFLNTLYAETIDAIEKQQQRTRLNVETVCRYVEENFAQGITLEQTADVFHVTKEYLSKAFKAHKQEGFSDYVTALRMKRAYELVAECDVPLKEVGAMVGYFDQAHFYKTFKKYFSQTPGEVRNRLKNDNEKTP